MVPPCSELVGSLSGSKHSPAALAPLRYQSGTGLAGSGPWQGDAAAGRRCSRASTSDPSYPAQPPTYSQVRSSSLYSTRGTGFTPTSGPHLAELSPPRDICSSVFVKQAKAALREAPERGCWLSLALVCILHPAGAAACYSL